MRIRKHAQKLQTSCFPVQLPFPDNQSPRRSPSTRVCELNQSPWDVMTFTSEEMDDSEAETAGAVEGILSLNGTWEEDYKKREKKEILCSSSTASVADKGRKRERTGMKSKVKTEEEFIYCNKTDGKGWKCKKEAKRGHSLCEHHLAQLKSYYTNNKTNPGNVSSGRKLKSGGAQISAATPVNKVCRRKRSSSSKTPSSNYYYYTGFGPLWGKGRAETKAKVEAITENREEKFDSSNSASTREPSSDDDAGVEENSAENGNAGKKKRARVKTRSLKSLL